MTSLCITPCSLWGELEGGVAQEPSGASTPCAVEIKLTWSFWVVAKVTLSRRLLLDAEIFCQWSISWLRR